MSALVRNPQNKQITNLFVYGTGQLFSLFTPLLVVPYLVHICGVGNYGKTSIGMALAFFLMVFIDYGSDISGVKDVAVNRDNANEIKKLFSVVMASKITLFLLLLLVLIPLFLFVPFFSKEKPLFFLGISVLVAHVFNPTWLLQGTEDFAKITQMTIVSKLIYLAGIFMFIHRESDYIYVNLIWGVGNIVAYLLALIPAATKRGLSLSMGNFFAVKQFLNKNFSLFSSQLFVSLQLYSPVMLLGFLGSDFLAGQFKIVEQVILIFRTYILLFFNFLFPRVCYLIEENTNQGIRFWRSFNGYNFVFVAISMVLLFLLSTEVIEFFTKTHIQEIAALLRPALGIPLLMAISVPLKQLVLAFGEQQKYTKATTVIVLISLVVMAGIIPVFSIKGLITTLLFTEFVTALIFFSFLYPRFFAKN